MKKTIILVTTLINLIVLPYFNIVLASKNDFYNKNNVYIFNPSDNCLGQNLVLKDNQIIGQNNQKLSKNIMKINDPDKFATAIDQWIKKSNPNSPMIGLGKYAVAGGMATGITPYLPIIIARKESNLGTAGSLTQKGNNAYGRTATKSQPHFNSSKTWYRWPSLKESLLSNQQDDMFHYLKRVYQNEQTIEQVMLKYAPPSENDTELYIKQLYQWADEIHQLAGDSIDVNYLGSTNQYFYNNCQSKSSYNDLNNFITYYQYQSPWAGHNFDPSCGNIKQCGCGPTTMAIILANLKNDRSINPIIISDQMNGMKVAQGTTFSALTIIPKRYGAKSEPLGSNVYQAINFLKKGYLIAVSVTKSIFTNGGHFIVFRGLTPEGNILVADPNSQKFTNNQRGFSPAEFNNIIKGMWAMKL